MAPWILSVKPLEMCTLLRSNKNLACPQDELQQHSSSVSNQLRYGAQTERIPITARSSPVTPTLVQIFKCLYSRATTGCQHSLVLPTFIRDFDFYRSSFHCTDTDTPNCLVSEPIPSCRVWQNTLRSISGAPLAKTTMHNSDQLSSDPSKILSCAGVSLTTMRWHFV